VTDSL